MPINYYMAVIYPISLMITDYNKKILQAVVDLTTSHKNKITNLASIVEFHSHDG